MRSSVRLVAVLRQEFISDPATESIAPRGGARHAGDRSTNVITAACGVPAMLALAEQLGLAANLALVHEERHGFSNSTLGLGNIF